MKRKVLALLIAALFLFNSAPLKTHAEEIANEDIKVEDRNVEISKVKEKIKEKAEMLVKHEIPYYDASSVQYAISEGDNIIISDNVENPDIKKDKTLTKDNMFGLCSVSKLYVTTAVMQLVDQKKVDLDLPVVNYIKEFEMADPNYKKITIRMLLNHSSGIMGSTLRNTVLFDDNDRYAHDNFLKQLKSQKLKSEPGKFSTYCNDGFTLAEILVERISGMSFSEYLAKYITNPLGLKNTKTPVDDFDRSSLAKTYIKTDTKDEEGKDVKKYCETPKENVNVIGTGGIYSSAEDLCKFGSNLVRKDGQGLLSPRSVDIMAEKECLKGLWVKDGEDGRTNYGLCWDCIDLFPFNRYGIKAVSKAGDSAFYQSTIIALPELNITMAVTSTGGGCFIDQSFAIEALLELLKEEGKIDDIHDYNCLKEGNRVFMPLSIKDESEGIYNLGTRISKVKIDDDGTLTLYDDMYGMPLIFKYTDSGYFINKEYQFGIRFVKEENGKTYMEQKSSYRYVGFLRFAMIDYMGEKTSDNSKMISEAWKQREGKKYYMIDDKYSSVNYSGSFMPAVVDINVNPYGYVGGAKIKNDSEALDEVELPGDIGRDLKRYKFSKENNKEYLEYNTFKYISGSDITFIDDKVKTVNIDDDGYTKWFKIPDSLDGKTITVESSPNTSFIVYDDKNNCINDSYVSKENSVKLKKGEVIALAGNPKESFKICIK